MGKKRGKSAKKARQGLVVQESEELLKAPHSFVIYRGRLGRNCGDVMSDFRKVMEPFTASQLKVMKQNVVKDFVSVAGMLNVTHLVIFTKTKLGMYVKIARLPRGPTLTFQIKNYTLAKDVLSSLKKRVTYAKQFEHHPLLVLNNFSGEDVELKLMSSMLQNMFPSINVNKVKLNTIRRCVLFNYNPDDKTVDFRHYTIKAVPCGIGKGVKKLIQNKVPDLSKFEDVSEFIEKSGNLSESEAEMDGPLNQIVLPQNLSSRGNVASQKSAIRLIELGPRLTLQLVKIEEGLMDGEVLYHTHVKKTQKEIEVLRLQRQKKKKLKQRRRETQEENQRMKEERKEEHKEKCLQGMKKGEDYDMDDAKWFEKELGEKPDADLFPSVKTEGGSKKRKATDHFGPMKKKVKFESWREGGTDEPNKRSPGRFPNRNREGGPNNKRQGTSNRGPMKKFEYRREGGKDEPKKRSAGRFPSRQREGGPNNKGQATPNHRPFKGKRKGNDESKQSAGRFPSRQREGGPNNKGKPTANSGPTRNKRKFESRGEGGKDQPKKRTRSLQEILKKRKNMKEKRKKKSVSLAKSKSFRMQMNKVKSKR